jgi:hypothetical protein
MITILKLLQNVARVRSRTMGEAELEVVWLLTAATFVAVGVQLISLTFAVNIGRILNSKDDIRAVRHVPHRGSSPKRTPPLAATVTYHSPAVSLFQKTVVQTGARITRVVGLRKGRQQDDPLPLATT